MARPRFRLITNPVASGVTQRTIAAAIAGLSEQCTVELIATEYQGHAVQLAREAVEAGFDAVAVLAGDGTANEVLNGAGTAIPVGALPAGGTSVLPRALGLPRDVRASASRIGDALVHGRERTINLGNVNGRRFSFAAGVGVDADAVRRVDAAGRPNGRRPGDMYFAAQIMRTLVSNRYREPMLEVTLPDGTKFEGVSVLAANTHPWSYIGPIALKLAPEASFESGLDVVVPKSMHRRLLARYASQLLVTGGHTRRDDRYLRYAHDIEWIDVRCHMPLPLHVDGDDLGDVTEARFEIERNAARVLV